MLEGSSVWLPPLSPLFPVFSFVPRETRNSYLLSFPVLADTHSSPRWYARTVGSLLIGINF
jgi:hypothetical protein